MKRLVAVFCFILTLVFSLSASAEWELPIIEENFSIRNGIAFGMTKDEAISVEKSNGNTPDFNEGNHIGYKKVNFLGKNAWLYHYFTNDNKLSSFAYSRMGKLGNSGYHTFADIRKALDEKYGEPMLTTELSLFSTAIWDATPFYLFNSRAKWSADTLSGGAAASSSDGSIWISNYAVWLVKYNDCAVVVELAEANRGEYLCLGYAGISHEDMDAWVGYRQKINGETEKSYSNDI